MAVNGTALLLVNVTYITVEILIGLCAIVGNVLVIWVVKLNPSLQTTTFYFIVSLALADIAVGVLVMPLAIVISLGITIHFYNCLFMTCLLLIFTHASIMSLLAIAVDRYLRVKLTVRNVGTPLDNIRSEQKRKGGDKWMVPSFANIQEAHHSKKNMVGPGPLLAGVIPGGTDPHVWLEHETDLGTLQKCHLPFMPVPFSHDDGLHGLLQLLHLDFNPPGCHVCHLS
ncbi:adenosine receptor A3 isoform X2 [Hyaena hyaena]|uniref:adenosine receptor A3 isoform X2 n=1 Tax=Hyaena hyaena TaxID=95912 RepID=UPI001921425A|nr:adenosine receptor A3 isoform X2 [Hyaena hyaena]